MQIIPTSAPAVLYQGDAAITSQTVTVNAATHGIANIQPTDTVSAAVKDDDTGGTLGGIVSSSVSGTDLVVVLQNPPVNNDGQLAVTVTR